MLEASFIIAFMVYFLKATTWKGMIFNKIKVKFNHWPGWIRKPLFQCPVCMTPWWGAVIYLIAFYAGLTEFSELSLVRIIYTLFTASGINAAFLTIFKIYDKHFHSE